MARALGGRLVAGGAGQDFGLAGRASRGSVPGEAARGSYKVGPKKSGEPRKNFSEPPKINSEPPSFFSEPRKIF